jgi:hypothetical protein
MTIEDELKRMSDGTESKTLELKTQDSKISEAKTSELDSESEDELDDQEHEDNESKDRQSEDGLDDDNKTEENDSDDQDNKAEDNNQQEDIDEEEHEEHDDNDDNGNDYDIDNNPQYADDYYNEQDQKYINDQKNNDHVDYEHVDEKHVDEEHGENYYGYGSHNDHYEYKGNDSQLANAAPLLSENKSDFSFLLDLLDSDDEITGIRVYDNIIEDRKEDRKEDGKEDGKENHSDNTNNHIPTNNYMGVSGTYNFMNNLALLHDINARLYHDMQSSNIIPVGRHSQLASRQPPHQSPQQLPQPPHQREQKQSHQQLPQPIENKHQYQLQPPPQPHHQREQPTLEQPHQYQLPHQIVQQHQLPPAENKQSLLPPQQQPQLQPRTLQLNNRRAHINNTHRRGMYGVPCPESGVTEEAKAIVLRCAICQSNQVQTVNFPCMHACFCLDCAGPAVQQSNICPQCRTAYMHVSMLYLCYKDADDDDIKHGSKRRRLE